MKETRDFEENIRELNREDATQAKSLLENFRFYRGVLKEHEGAEEEFYFPLIEGRFRYLSGAYLFEHEHHSHLYQEIEALLSGLMQARGNSEGVELSHKLNRLAIALHVLMDSHISKENELMIPVFNEHFTIEELAEVAGRHIASIPQESMMQELPWLFKCQGVNDREGFLRMLMGVMPLPAFLGLAGKLSTTVPAAEWQEMVRRIPQLAKPAA